MDAVINVNLPFLWNAYTFPADPKKTHDQFLHFGLREISLIFYEP